MPRPRIRFDANQDYQIEAINAVADLLQGLERDDRGLGLAGDEVVANMPSPATFDRMWLLSNLQDVQARNRVERSPTLVIDSTQELAGVSDDSWDWPSFTIEMETGTGKTYVYLRTIMELRKQYGFRKFLIVVPSVAIYEGVAKTFEMTRTHFASLYGNEPVHLIRYDGAQLSKLREFATSSFCEILLITLDSFNKASNVIYRPSEKLPGERLPFQFIQETRPILIMDEPQNMESQLARSALATLHPLFALRYSATHRTSPNLVYRLTPFEAFRRNLVKRIQVFGVTEKEDANEFLLRLVKIERSGGLRAKILAHVDEKGRTKEKEVTLKAGDNLHGKTGREEHTAGYVVSEINIGEKWIQFENGLRVREGDDVGYDKPEVFRIQIRETLQRHMQTQEYLREKGIKVLSLFFIDRVSNYTDDRGLIRTLFDKEFKKLRRSYSGFDTLDPAAVRTAYFASRRKGKGGEVELIDLALDEEKQKKEEREAAKRAFELIMRDKERLLSMEEPVSFIFTHSALKEGWDNPNVFQICTLNQTTSEVKKRQEIGRGLRLCVNQNGERVHGDQVNVLTVIANQSYQSYAEQLQQEYREEGQEADAPPKPTNAKGDAAKRNDNLFKGSAEFGELWRRLSKRLRYEIAVDSDDLVRRCVQRLNNTPFPEPKVVVQRGDYVMYHYQLRLVAAMRGQAKIELIMESTAGDDVNVTRTYDARADLEKLMNDPRLRGFQITKVAEGKAPSVTFANKVELQPDTPYEFSSTAGQKVLDQATFKPETSHPVFNVIERAQRETKLTRATLNRLFREMKSAAQRKIFSNPEGWAGQFISVIREELADLVSESLTFQVDGDASIDLEELFPPATRYAQKEVRPAGATGLYDQVQVDSNVEDVFVRRLREDPQVVLYFKFPPAFRVGLPKLIGNYNPDWGIVRRDEEGSMTLHLVRETKGGEDIRTLRFPNEKRKVVCAKKYFDTAGVDYRVIRESTPEWWKPEDSIERQLEITTEPSQ